MHLSNATRRDLGADKTVRWVSFHSCEISEHKELSYDGKIKNHVCIWGLGERNLERSLRMVSGVVRMFHIMMKASLIRSQIGVCIYQNLPNAYWRRALFHSLPIFHRKNNQQTKTGSGGSSITNTTNDQFLRQGLIHLSFLLQCDNRHQKVCPKYPHL